MVKKERFGLRLRLAGQIPGVKDDDGNSLLFTG
jgi:hypothetical protein